MSVTDFENTTDCQKDKLEIKRNAYTSPTRRHCHIGRTAGPVTNCPLPQDKIIPSYTRCS